MEVGKKEKLLNPKGKVNTIADSLKTNMGDLTWPLIQKNVDGIVQVSEDEIRQGMRLTLER